MTVVVVGAGVSGLTTGVALLEAGFSARVVAGEASRANVAHGRAM
jgi:cation diffusion facilitator CzcD-associated flavoprotein CzcO